MIGSNVRYAIRSLRRTPLFVAVATVTLGLGIGLTATMFTVLDAIIHPHSPYEDVDRLYTVQAWGDGTSGKVTQFQKYQALVEGTRSFEGIAAVGFGGLGLAEAFGNAEQIQYSRVGGNYFPLLGMKPEQGRFFSDGLSGPEEDKAVVSYGFWRRVLLGRPVVDGLSFTLEGRTYQVIGVLPPEAQRRGDVYLRLPGATGAAVPAGLAVAPVVRLRTDQTEAAAYNELSVVAAQLTRTYGQGRQPFSFRLYPLRIPPREIDDLQLAMGGATVAVLLIACANLASLMLARGLNRRRELALRQALGASRRDLAGQLLTESALLGFLGGSLGTILAVWGVGLVRQRLPAEGLWIGFLVPQVDWRVFAFALAATVVAIVAFGVVPALKASDISLNEPLKEGAISSGSRRRYSLLVVTEVALSLVLLMAAGLLLRRLQESLERADPGSRSLLMGSVGVNNRQMASDTAVQRFFRDLGGRLREVPGVVDVAFTGSRRTAAGAITSDFEGPKPRFVVRLFYETVSAEYLRVVRRPVVLGRDFESGDAMNQSVAVVDENLVALLWPQSNPIGRMVKLGGPDAAAPWVRVIGMIRSRPSYYRYGPAPTELLVLQPDHPGSSRGIVARIDGNSAVVAAALRQKVRDALPGGLAGGVMFWDFARNERDSVRRFSFMTKLFSSFGATALLLATVGLYGVLAYSVGQRMREFSIRIALGAENSRIFKLVLHDAAVMILAGTGIGAWLAMWAGQLMISEDTSMIPSTDWAALVLGELVLLLVCFVASLSPAIRASRANPLEIIRAI